MFQVDSFNLEDLLASERYVPNNIFSSDDDDDENEDDSEIFRIKRKPETLQDLIQSEGFFDKIETPVNVSKGEILFMILKYCTKNKLAITHMSQLLALVNSIFTKSILPQSSYMIDKFFNVNENATFHVTCPVCGTYVGNLENLDPEVKCDICNSKFNLSNPSAKNLFAVIDPSSAIASLINTHSKDYEKIITEHKHEKNHIHDIYDGKMYRQFVSSLPVEDKFRYVTAVFNSDGAAPFKSSPLSVWPIYLMINELPVQIRFNNLIPCALWFNREKPNMSVFLDVFVDIINKLSTQGIKCVINNEERNIKLYALTCCVDTIARSPMQGLTQFNGKYGCNWCLHPTKWVGSTKYPLLDYIPENRTADNTIKHMRQLRNSNNKPIFGVKKVSPLINLQSFDIVKGFVPDYMHCILAGVAKQITEYLIKSEDINFYQSIINKIRVPHQICR